MNRARKWFPHVLLLSSILCWHRLESIRSRCLCGFKREHEHSTLFVRFFSVNLFVVPEVAYGCNAGRACTKCVQIVC